MNSFKKTLSSRYNQLWLFIAMLLAILGAVILINGYSSAIFERFIGDLNPLISGIVIGILGAFSLYYLISKGAFVLYDKGRLKSAMGLIWILIPLLFITVFIDLNIVYPEDMNIAFPVSLVFYPVIAFFVEIVFHLLPLTIFLLLLSAVFRNSHRKLLILIGILSVSILEPSYQAVFMEDCPLWAIALLWINLYLFNLLQLFVFWRYDFLSMYIFRLGYYAIWHIVWGHYRLELLF